MKIACLGGGPAGLYFAISMKLRDASHDITVIERNCADDTFGWGVVLSDETLANLKNNDSVSAEAIQKFFAYWDDIALVHRGERLVSSGHGFCGIGRRKLLELLQERAVALGVKLEFETEIDDIEALCDQHDLVIAADGVNSRTRAHFEEHFKPEVDRRACKFVWLGTNQKFDDAFTFIFENTEHGWVWAHAYQFDSDTATFIVECSEATWDAWGFGSMKCGARLNSTISWAIAPRSWWLNPVQWGNPTLAIVSSPLMNPAMSWPMARSESCALSGTIQ